MEVERDVKGRFVTWRKFEPLEMFKVFGALNFVVSRIYGSSVGIVYTGDKGEVEGIKEIMRERLLEETESYLGYVRDDFWFLPVVSFEVSKMEYDEELVDTEDYFVE